MAYLNESHIEVADIDFLSINRAIRTSTPGKNSCWVEAVSKKWF